MAASGLALAPRRSVGALEGSGDGAWSHSREPQGWACLNERLEQEVKRIAHALHDEAGQVLSTVFIKLDQMQRELPAPHRHRLQEVSSMLDQVEGQLRHLSHELRPNILDDLGLVPALEYLAAGVSRRAGLAITVEGSTQGRLPAMVETALYRIVQEALTNVSQHASARRVRVRLSRDSKIHSSKIHSSTIHCSIQDDGVGCDIEGVLSQRGTDSLGLLGMRERVHALDGTLSIDSAPGEGMELTVTVPLGVSRNETQASDWGGEIGAMPAQPFIVQSTK
jgi:signal transduction histidine kinase